MLLNTIVIPNYQEALTREKVKRVKADMRTLSAQIEAYLLEYEQAPTDPERIRAKSDMEALVRDLKSHAIDNEDYPDRAKPTLPLLQKPTAPPTEPPAKATY